MDPVNPLHLVNVIINQVMHNKAFVGHTGVISGTSKGSAVITVSYTENGITKSDTIDVIVAPFIAGDD